MNESVPLVFDARNGSVYVTLSVYMCIFAYQYWGWYLGNRKRSLHNELVNSDISLQRWWAVPGA